MNPTIVLPELPDTTDPKAVKDYLSAHQKILADKQKDDYESLTGAKGLIFPVGTWYTQYPSVKSNDEAVAFPESEEPANKFGGVWTEPFAGEYTFFRTTGTDGQTRVNGFSADQMQKLTGTLLAMVSSTPGNSGVGALRLSAQVNNRVTGAALGAGSYTVSFDSTNSPDAKVSADTTGFTEVRNYLVRVWYRES